MNNFASTNFKQIMASKYYASARPIYVIPAQYLPAYRNSKYYQAAGANKSYEETEFHQALIVNADSLGYTFDNNDDRPERIVKTFFAAISSYLSKRKVSKEDEAVALVLQDTAGNFKFAGIVEYFINAENPDEPGNWSYTMTLNEEDLTDLEKRKAVKKYLVGDDIFRNIMDKVSYDVGGFVFERDSYIYDTCLLVVDTIVQVLDHEAKEGQVVDIEMPGYFVASVAVENGEKVFSVTPDGHMKALVKSDIDLDE